MSLNIPNPRRDFLRLLATVGTGLMLSGCRSITELPSEQPEEKQALPRQYGSEADKKVMAVEDLMREHGVIRRALLAFTEIAARLDTNNFSDVTSNALQRTTRLLRVFGEEYHAKKLEEAYVFPVIKRAGGPAAIYPDILIAQHQRGYELTDYILAVTQKQLDTLNTELMARVLKSFVLMYRNHTAREDTVVFPAWKQTLSAQQFDEMSDKFEKIEHQMLGTNGFEHILEEISSIEDSLGLSDLAQFTAIPPPKS